MREGVQKLTGLFNRMLTPLQGVTKRSPPHRALPCANCYKPFGLLFFAQPRVKTLSNEPPSIS